MLLRIPSDALSLTYKLRHRSTIHCFPFLSVQEAASGSMNSIYGAQEDEPIGEGVSVDAVSCTMSHSAAAQSYQPIYENLTNATFDENMTCSEEISENNWANSLSTSSANISFFTLPDYCIIGFSAGSTSPRCTTAMEYEGH
ncbi:hypothetical protein BDV96DRAFT_26731 [Lophiotrema nucula]|uniref:Uncharacterized protein n=1 Tax=Lophiotrema nucula TaxID=690887 RepID=A0A6A5ZD79_9PLEO|nr:hypothetical protein BDV96DRAFT_26731 [Lophiotrema nucula]